MYIAERTIRFQIHLQRIINSYKTTHNRTSDTSTKNGSFSHARKVNPGHPVLHIVSELDLMVKNVYFSSSPFDPNLSRIFAIVQKTGQSKMFHLATAEHYEKESNDYKTRTNAYRCLGTNDPLSDLEVRTK